jgi:hypothetical protein
VTNRNGDRGKEKKPLRQGGAADSSVNNEKAESAPRGLWKDRLTLAIALWGAVVGTAVAIRDSAKAFYDSLPQFFVRTEIDLDDPAKSTGHITVRTGNVGTPTATLDPTL